MYLCLELLTKDVTLENNVQNLIFSKKIFIQSCFFENVKELSICHKLSFSNLFVIVIELRYSKLWLLLQQTDISKFYTIRLQKYWYLSLFYGLSLFLLCIIYITTKGRIYRVCTRFACCTYSTVQLSLYQPKSRPDTLNWIGVFNGLNIKSKIFVKATLALFLILQKKRFFQIRYFCCCNIQVLNVCILKSPGQYQLIFKIKITAIL